MIPRLDPTELALEVARMLRPRVERPGLLGAELDAPVREVGYAQAVAVLMLIGRYVTHALMVNALGLAPPVTSPLEPL